MAGIKNGSDIRSDGASTNKPASSAAVNDFAPSPLRTTQLFSKRARQIQADSGVTPQPAPYLPPALRDGASPEQQEGTSAPGFSPPSSNTSSSSGKGRARAGTLPSSWGSGEGATPSSRFSSPLATRLEGVESPNGSEPAHQLSPRRGTSSAGLHSPGAPGTFGGGRLGALRADDSGQASRLRSGSLTSAMPGLGNNAFGPSMFSSTWQGSNGAGQSSSARQRGSSVSFLDEDMVTSPSSASASRPSIVESLDGSENVQTLDYLGLADSRGSISGERTSPSGFASRNRASTLAAGTRTAGHSSLDSISGNGNSLLGSSLYDADESDIYAAYAREHGIDPTAFAAVAAAAGFPPAASGQQGTGGRLRAGTVAALGGPGGRQRVEQELLRLAMAGHFVGGSSGASSGIGSGMSSSNNGMSSPSSSMTGFGPGGSSGSFTSSAYTNAPLEGFPHVQVSTPKSELNPSLSSPLRGVTPSTPNGSVPTEPRSATTIQTPTRSLWIGNLDPSTTGQELMHVFAPYGAIESLRLLPEKECGFVNFVEMADAIRAREDVLTRLGGRISKAGMGPGGTVRIGYGKVDSAPTAPGSASGLSTPALRGPGGLNSPRVETPGFENGPGTPGETGPTRALWVGSIPSTTTPATLLSVFQPFGAIESARVLTHKNCGFINFERVDDAVMARKMLNGRDVLGSEVGAMRIGFAKVPVRNIDGFPGEPSTAGFAAAIEALAALKGATSVPLSAEEQVLSGGLENYRSNLVADLLAQQQQALQAQAYENASHMPSPGGGAGTAGSSTLLRATSLIGASSSNSIVPSSDKGGVPLPSDMVPRPAVSDLQLLMRELSEDDNEADTEADVAAVSEFRPPATYYTAIPLVSEVSSSRRFDTSRLRELRKTIEAGACSQEAVDIIAAEHMDAIVDLASDYIGNTVVQKLFERCSEHIKRAMLEQIAPHLAMIGIHKNGTWAAQKIIERAQSQDQVSMIAQNLRPYVPPLLLDQFGNYVVQCCLPWPGPAPDFVFDAMVDRCWEIAQGRFGARSMRACLENSHVTKRQRKRVAIAIILNSVPLATSPNGALLLTWLLDTSALSGRYRLLAPRFSPYLGHLCTHKLASLTVLRIVSQKVEPTASRVILSALFDSPRDQVLEEVLTDQVHGSQFITKVLASNCFSADARSRYVEQVKRIVISHSLVGVPAYRKLVEDLGLPPAPAPGQIGGVGATPRTDLNAPPLLGPFMGTPPPTQTRFAAPPGGQMAPGSTDLNTMLAQMQLQQAGMLSPGAAPSGLAQPFGMGSIGMSPQGGFAPMGAGGFGPPGQQDPPGNSGASFPTHIRSPQSDAFNPWSNPAEWDHMSALGSPPPQLRGGAPGSMMRGTPQTPQRMHYNGNSPIGPGAPMAGAPNMQGRHPFLEQLGPGGAYAGSYNGGAQ